MSHQEDQQGATSSSSAPNNSNSSSQQTHAPAAAAAAEGRDFGGEQELLNAAAADKHSSSSSSSSNQFTAIKRKADTLSDDGEVTITDNQKKQCYGDDDLVPETDGKTAEEEEEEEEEVAHEVDLDALLDGSEQDGIVVHGYDKASVLATAAAAAAAAAASTSTAIPIPTATTTSITNSSSNNMIAQTKTNTSSTTALVVLRRQMWDTRLKELTDFKALTGHCLVPKIYPPNPALGRWVGRQRSQYKLLREGCKSRLTEERVLKLQQLGFVWYAGPQGGLGAVPGASKKDKKQKQESTNSNQDATTQTTAAVAEHKSSIIGEDGVVKIEEPTKVVDPFSAPHTQDATVYDGSSALAAIKGGVGTATTPIITQEEMVNVKKDYGIPLPVLPPFDLANLDVGNTTTVVESPEAVAGAAAASATTTDQMVSSPSSTNARQDQWELRFQELLLYQAKHGTCRVPRTVPVLGRWVKKQREHNKRRASGKCTSLTLQRLEKLDAVGFVWECTQPDDWQSRFLQLKQYKVIHGNCLVPKKHSTLGRWVGRQRSLYKDYRDGKPSSLTPERISLLTDIDFVWCAASPSAQNKLPTLSSEQEQEIAAAPVTTPNSDNGFTEDIALNESVGAVISSSKICENEICPV